MFNFSILILFALFVSFCISSYDLKNIAVILHFAWRLILANITLIGRRSQPNHQSKGDFSFIVKHLVFRLQLNGTGYRFFSFCLGFLSVSGDRLICRICLYCWRFSGALYLSTTLGRVQGKWVHADFIFGILNREVSLFCCTLFDFCGTWSFTNSSIYCPA